MFKLSKKRSRFNRRLRFLIGSSLLKVSPSSCGRLGGFFFGFWFTVIRIFLSRLRKGYLVHFLEICAVVRTMGGLSDHMRGELLNLRENTSIGLWFASASLLIEMVFLLQLFLNLMAGLLDELLSIRKILIDDFLTFILGRHVFFDMVIIEILPPLDPFRLQCLVFGLTVLPIIDCHFPTVSLRILYGGIMREQVMYPFSWCMTFLWFWIKSDILWLAPRWSLIATLIGTDNTGYRAINIK